MSDCLFCKIINGDIPSQKIYEDEKVLAFQDASPSAKNHWLFIHKNHTANINEISDNHPEQLSDVFSAISKVTKEKNITESGFRIVTNQGADGGQTVFHTHFHVLSGEKLKGFGSK